MENAPALALDKILYKDGKIPPHVVRERRIVWNLIQHLAAAGHQVVEVFDGEEYARTPTPKDAMEVIFNLDEARVFFMKSRNPGKHGVYLVLGNDLDVVSDWSYSTNDPDGFDAAMEKFDAEAFA